VVSHVFVDFNKNTSTPEVIIRPYFSMAIPNTEVFCSLSFIFEEQNISKLQT